MRKTVIWMLVTLVFCCVVAKPVFAFAGGGGADYGGGGFTGGGFNTDNDYYRYNNRSYNHNNSFFKNSEKDKKNDVGLFILIIIGAGIAIFISHVTQSNREITSYDETDSKEIRPLNTQDPEELAIQQFVEKIFYPIQEAWQNQNLECVKKYYAEDLFQLHADRVGKMKADHQKNIIKDLRLCRVGNLYWYEKDRNFSVEVKAQAIDYVIDTDTNRVVKGRKTEYGILREEWFFRKGENDSWLLYRIK